MPDDAAKLEAHRVVSHDEWLRERTALLAREKELTKLRDELSRARRELPWEAVTKDYVFEGPKGRESLGDLFDGSSQLIVYHFMFDPGWAAGCPHCSHWADSFNGAIVHLNHRDVSMVAISQAPYRQLEAYHQRMGWTFRWLSSFENDFNFDCGVTFTPEEVASKQGRSTTSCGRTPTIRSVKASACSIAMPMPASSTPTRPTPAGSTR